MNDIEFEQTLNRLSGQLDEIRDDISTHATRAEPAVQRGGALFQTLESLQSDLIRHRTNEPNQLPSNELNQRLREAEAGIRQLERAYDELSRGGEIAEGYFDGNRDGDISEDDFADLESARTGELSDDEFADLEPAREISGDLSDDEFADLEPALEAEFDDSLFAGFEFSFEEHAGVGDDLSNSSLGGLDIEALLQHATAIHDQLKQEFSERLAKKDSHASAVEQILQFQIHILNDLHHVQQSYPFVFREFERTVNLSERLLNLQTTGNYLVNQELTVVLPDKHIKILQLLDTCKHLDRLSKDLLAGHFLSTDIPNVENALSEVSGRLAALREGLDGPHDQLEDPVNWAQNLDGLQKIIRAIGTYQRNNAPIPGPVSETMRSIHRDTQRSMIALREQYLALGTEQLSDLTIATHNLNDVLNAQIELASEILQNYPSGSVASHVELYRETQKIFHRWNFELAISEQMALAEFTSEERMKELGMLSLRDAYTLPSATATEAKETIIGDLEADYNVPREQMEAVAILIQLRNLAHRFSYLSGAEAERIQPEETALIDELDQIVRFSPVERKALERLQIQDRQMALSRKNNIPSSWAGLEELRKVFALKTASAIQKGETQREQEKGVSFFPEAAFTDGTYTVVDDDGNSFDLGSDGGSSVTWNAETENRPLDDRDKRFGGATRSGSLTTARSIDVTAQWEDRLRNGAIDEFERQLAKLESMKENLGSHEIASADQNAETLWRTISDEEQELRGDLELLELADTDYALGDALHKKKVWQAANAGHEETLRALKSNIAAGIENQLEFLTGMREWLALNVEKDRAAAKNLPKTVGEELEGLRENLEQVRNGQLTNALQAKPAWAHARTRYEETLQRTLPEAVQELSRQVQLPITATRRLWKSSPVTQDIRRELGALSTKLADWNEQLLTSSCAGEKREANPQQESLEVLEICRRLSGIWEKVKSSQKDQAELTSVEKALHTALHAIASQRETFSRLPDNLQSEEIRDALEAQNARLRQLQPQLQSELETLKSLHGQTPDWSSRVRDLQDALASQQRNIETRQSELTEMTLTLRKEGIQEVIQEGITALQSSLQELGGAAHASQRTFLERQIETFQELHESLQMVISMPLSHAQLASILTDIESGVGQIAQRIRAAVNVGVESPPRTMDEDHSSEATAEEEILPEDAATITAIRAEYTGPGEPRVIIMTRTGGELTPAAEGFRYGPTKLHSTSRIVVKDVEAISDEEGPQTVFKILTKRQARHGEILAILEGDINRRKRGKEPRPRGDRAPIVIPRDGDELDNRRQRVQNTVINGVGKIFGR